MLAPTPKKSPALCVTGSKGRDRFCPSRRRTGAKGEKPCPRILSLDRFQHRLSEACGAFGDGYAGGAHGFDLVVGAALAAGDDGAGMAHAAAGWCCAPGDEARAGLGAAALGLVFDDGRGCIL